MNENIKEQGETLVDDIKHSLVWALREHGVEGQLALRNMLLRELGLQVVGEVYGRGANWTADDQKLDEIDGHHLYVIA
ncbi:MAG: hypothetical protein EKK53_21465 [Burkholderiales bacterium]|nr:MAG: hypothetical protein EKK53_21465 [Burkholderiales bacterium]